MLTVSTTGEKLKAARRQAMLTQGELAKKAGVGITTIVRIEKGYIPEPRVSTLRKLATALEIDPRQLLGD
jgi:transcriptional regulator with XRE-family HTH domain